MENTPTEKTDNNNLHTGKTISLCAGIGMIFGVALGNIGFGLVLGAAAGLVFGKNTILKR